VRRAYGSRRGGINAVRRGVFPQRAPRSLEEAGVAIHVRVPVRTEHERPARWQREVAPRLAMQLADALHLHLLEAFLLHGGLGLGTFGEDHPAAVALLGPGAESSAVDREPVRRHAVADQRERERPRALGTHAGARAG